MTILRLLGIVFCFLTVRGLENAYIIASTTSHVVVLPDVHGDSESLLRSLWLAAKHVDGPVAPFPVFSGTIRNYMRKGTKSMRGSRQVSIPLSARADVAVVVLGEVLDLACMKIILAIPKIFGWRVLPLVRGPTQGKPKGSNQLQKLITNNFMGFAMIRTGNSFTGNKAWNPSTLFVHSGLGMDWLEKHFARQNGRPTLDLNKINGHIQRLLQSGNGSFIDSVVGDYSRLVWTRVLATAPEAVACGLASRLIEKFQVARIVVGHSSQGDSETESRCNGAIVLSDSMMSGPLPGSHAIVMTINTATEELESMIAHYMDDGDMEQSVDLMGANASMTTISPDLEYAAQQEEDEIDYWKYVPSSKRKAAELGAPIIPFSEEWFDPVSPIALGAMPTSIPWESDWTLDPDWAPSWIPIQQQTTQSPPIKDVGPPPIEFTTEAMSNDRLLADLFPEALLDNDSVRAKRPRLTKEEEETIFGFLNLDNTL